MKKLVTLLLVSIGQMGVAGILLNNLSMEHWSVIYAEDSEGYLLVARYFQGVDIPPSSLPLLKYRLFSPVVPWVASLGAQIIPLPVTFLILNGSLWLVTIFLFYRFARSLLDDEAGYHCALLLTTSLPFIIWGLPIMTDMAAFFFAVLHCHLIVTFPSKGKSVPWILAFTLPLAILTKPTLISLLFFFIVYMFVQGRYREPIPVVLISLILLVGVYSHFNLGMKDFQTYGYPRHQGLVYILNGLVFCFHWGIPLAVWGMWRERKQTSFYLTYFICTFGCYLLFVHNPRLLFVVFPAIIPLIVKGMKQWVSRIAYRWHQEPARVMTFLVVGYMVTSNVLAIVYLLVTRVLQYRSLEQVIELLR